VCHVYQNWEQRWDLAGYTLKATNMLYNSTFEHENLQNEKHI